MKKVIQRTSPRRIYRCFINDHFVHWAVEEPLRPFGCILRHQGGFWQQGRQVERYEGDFSLGKFCYFYQTISDLWLCFWIATRGGQQLTSCSHHLQGALIPILCFSHLRKWNCCGGGVKSTGITFFVRQKAADANVTHCEAVFTTEESKLKSSEEGEGNDEEEDLTEPLDTHDRKTRQGSSSQYQSIYVYKYCCGNAV